MSARSTMKIGSLLELPKGASMPKKALESRRSCLSPFCEETVETFAHRLQEISIILCGKKHERDGLNPYVCHLRRNSACCGHQTERDGNALARLRAACFILDAIHPAMEDDGSWEKIAALTQNLLGLDNQARNGYCKLEHPYEFDEFQYQRDPISQPKDAKDIVRRIKERERELGAEVLQICDAMIKKFEQVFSH